MIIVDLLKNIIKGMKRKVEVCPHLKESSFKNFHKAKVNPFKCSFMHAKQEIETVELWTCIECNKTGCSRSSTNRCLEKHFEETRHALVFNLKEEILWCYKCDINLAEIDSKIDIEAENQLEKDFTEYFSRFKQIMFILKKELKQRRLKKGQRKGSDLNSSEVHSIKEKKSCSPEKIVVPKIDEKKRVSENADSIFGLQNLGNTCFFNSITQIVLNSARFIETLKKDIGKLSGKGLAREILSLHAMGCQGGKVLNPKRVLYELQKHNKMYASYGQQDSHECFTSYLEILEKEYKKAELVFRIPFFGYFTYKCFCSNCKNEEWVFEESGSMIFNLTSIDPDRESDSHYHSIIQKNSNLLKTRVHGKEMSFLKINSKAIVPHANVEKSGFNPKKQNLFIDLKTQLSPTEARNDFDIYLENYFGYRIHSSQEDGYRCDKCKRSDKSSSYFGYNKFYIVSPPEILVIVLKRFKPGRWGMQKDDRKVSCGLELDLTKYYLAKVGKNEEPISPTSQILYRLYGIVEHSGSISGGHYVCYVKKESGSWYYISDSHYSTVSEDSIKKNRSGYIYFYQLVK